MKGHKAVKWALWTVPLWCCPVWISAGWAFEKVDLLKLDRLVNERELPAQILMKDGKNDWPFGTSNGAFVRMRWLLQTPNAEAVRVQVLGLRSATKGAQFDLDDVGIAPGEPGQRLMLLQASYGRGNFFWELPD